MYFEDIRGGFRHFVRLARCHFSELDPCESNGGIKSADLAFDLRIPKLDPIKLPLLPVQAYYLTDSDTS